MTARFGVPGSESRPCKGRLGQGKGGDAGGRLRQGRALACPGDGWARPRAAKLARGRTSRRWKGSGRGGRLCLWLGLGALGLASCVPRTPGGVVPSPPREVSAGQVPLLLPEPDPEGRAWVERTLASLSVREAVGQLIMPWMSGAYAAADGPEMEEFLGYVEEGLIGGVVISIGLPHSYGAKLNLLQDRARIPLLVASDFESGGPGMRINHVYALPSLLPQGGGTAFPPTMAFGAIGEESFAREYGRITALEARAVGVHLNFAPVLDVNSNPANPIINTRSFGEDPLLVARLGVAYLAGAREGGVLTTAKHFPGHGDTRSDSHVELPVVDADMERLEAVELVPFRRAVEAGVDAIMTAHVAVPRLLGPEGPPATLSAFFLTELLRRRMGFGGIILTDALSMRAIADHYGAGEAAVLALEAGADILLAPGDVRETARAVEAAVASGRLSRERIWVSARRVLEAKARVGLHQVRRVDLEKIHHRVGIRAHTDFAELAAARSLTLPRDRERLLPLEVRRYPDVLQVVYARADDLVAGRALAAALGGAFLRFRTLRFTPESPPSAYEELARVAASATLVVVSIFVPPRSGAGEVAVVEPLARWVEETAGRRPTVVVSFGNPYLLSAFPSVGTYLLAWGPQEVSQRAAARALLGEIPVTGRLPISLPPFHRAGEGLEREAEGGRGPGPGWAPARVAAAPEGGGVPTDPRTPVAPSRDPYATRPEESRAQCLRLTEGASWAALCQQVGGMTASPLEVDPSGVGMEAARLARVDSLLLAALADSASPGAALAVGRHGRLVRLRGYGKLDWRDDAPPATPASLWDLASVTKVAATTTAAMLLVEEGVLDLDRRVVEVLPWWGGGDPRKSRVTVRHLLLHRAGLPPFRTFFRDMAGREAYRKAIGDLPLDYNPGDSTVYSDLGMMTLAFLMEELTGKPLDRFLQERVWDPLGLEDTGFAPPSDLLPRIAPTERDTTWRRMQVHGAVHDENAYAMGGVAGHAGLFSSARDLAVLAQLFLSGGTVAPCTGEAGSGVPCSRPRPEAVRLVEAATVELFTRRHDASSSRALGWDTPSGMSSAGDYLSSRAFGHTGFTGTSVWIDPELDLFVVLLTSRTNPTRENQKHVSLRRAVHDAVALSVTDRPVFRRERDAPSSARR